EYLESSFARNEEWRSVPTGRTPTLLFWYRTSPSDLMPIRDTAVSPGNPPLTLIGMRLVVLDPQGRLTQLRAIPPQFAEMRSAGAPAPNWSLLFEAAALPMAAFHPVAPAWTPRDYADARAAWDGSAPDLPGAPLHGQAA